MNKIAAFIESGLLELYVLGATSEAETREVTEMAAAHSEIRAELEAIRAAMETYGGAQALAPHATVKPMLFATIDFMERLQNGETPASPPLLHEHSRAEDYAEWIHRADMTRPADADDLFVKLIGHTPQATTGIVWITTPAYINLLFTERVGNLMLLGCGLWMGAGITVMRGMINFKH